MRTASTAMPAEDRTHLEPAATRLLRVSAAVGGSALLLGFLLGLLGGRGFGHFFHAYLVSYLFYLSISLGALFFVALQHATRAGWSVSVRRVNEILAANMPLLAILFLPIMVSVLSGRQSIYPWANPVLAGRSELIQHKQAYLNVPFFVVRSAIYLAVWTLLARFFLTRSLQQDESGDPALTLRMERVSYPALLLLAATITFASFDWIMSLEPEWFSTIFGIYYFSGAAVGSLAVTILLLVLLQNAGKLTETVTVEHYHDLGKLLLAFVVFWGYIAFSQYMLIWYANIPEETTWYLDRQTSAWVGVSLGLLFGHLLVPFLGLLPREAKRRKAVLGFWAIWLLVFHWVDLYWLVMPSFDAYSLPLGLVDLCLLVGLGGLYLAGVLRIAGRRPLVPLKDPRLAEALAFENL